MKKFVFCFLLIILYSALFSKNYAILIGVNNYKYIEDLLWAEKDVIDMSSILKEYDFEVQILLNNEVSAEEIKKIFDKVNSISVPEDLIFFYFSGHGMGNEELKDKSILFHDYNKTTGYLTHNDLINYISGFNGDKVVFLDACNQGISYKNLIVKKETDIKEALKKKDIDLYIAASSSNQYACEGIELEEEIIKNGLATHLLIKGIENGKIDMNEDTIISVGEVSEYINGIINKSTDTDFTQKPEAYYSDYRLPFLKVSENDIESKVKITTNNEDTDLFINDKYIGKLPIAISLKEGKYKITLDSESYEKYEIIIQINEENKNLYFEMTPKNMILVNSGKYIMGKDTVLNRRYGGFEHEVIINYDYYIGKYEVTFDEYDEFCISTGKQLASDLGKTFDGKIWSNNKNWGRGKRPVINVNWFDAIEYCNWKSQKELIPSAYDTNGNLLDENGMITTDISQVKGYRLPTEAEWEFAAVGGVYNYSYKEKYLGRKSIDDVAWYWRNSGDSYKKGDWSYGAFIEGSMKTQEVGQKEPNRLGIYDMCGNVWEWCTDWYGEYGTSTIVNPVNMMRNENSTKILRGFSWIDFEELIDLKSRYFSSAMSKDSCAGFRIAKLKCDKKLEAPFNEINNIDIPPIKITSDFLPEKTDENQEELNLNHEKENYEIDIFDNFDMGKFMESNLIVVEKGNFFMGNTRYDEEGDKDEIPIHEVELNYDFYMGKYEVTQKEYDVYCEEIGKDFENGYFPYRQDRPIVNISFKEVISYCNWLSERENLPKAFDKNGDLLNEKGQVTLDIRDIKGYRLPTEAEWEYTARGGHKSGLKTEDFKFAPPISKDYKYSGSNSYKDVCHNRLNSFGMPNIVGQKKPNQLGIYDMSGNVWEYCLDSFLTYSEKKEINPFKYTSETDKRVLRGGSFYSIDLGRVSERNFIDEQTKFYEYGFRIARTK